MRSSAVTTVNSKTLSLTLPKMICGIAMPEIRFGCFQGYDNRQSSFVKLEVFKCFSDPNLDIHSPSRVAPA